MQDEPGDAEGEHARETGKRDLEEGHEIADEADVVVVPCLETIAESQDLLGDLASQRQGVLNGRFRDFTRPVTGCLLRGEPPLRAPACLDRELDFLVERRGRRECHRSVVGGLV